MIDAIAAGNRAAKSIDQYLKSGKVTASDEDVVEKLLHNVGLGQRQNGGIVTGKERQSPQKIALVAKKPNFSEVERCFTMEEAAAEAERCLRCYRVMMLATTSKK